MASDPHKQRSSSTELRYQALFENNPVSIWEEDFSLVGEWFAELRKQGIDDLGRYLHEHPDQVMHAATLVRITQANKAALALLKLDSKDQIVGSFQNLIKSETREIFVAELVAIWEGRTLISLEGSGRTATGEGYNYVLNMLIPEEEGRLCLETVIVVIMDVTPIKEAERARLTTLREKEAVLGAIPETIFTVDTEVRLKEYNRPLGTLCPHAANLRSGDLLVGPGDEQGCPCTEVARRTVADRAPIRGFRARCSNSGRGRSLELSGSPLLDSEDRFIGAVVVVHDMTRMESLEELARGEGRHGLASLVGRSKPMQAVYGLIEQVAAVDSTVLITGESGTGKELVAEAIHYLGSRSGKPLVKVNCSALSENLLESELFGHVRGSFSGAVADKLGRFQLAEGGTLFLDEIGDISPLIQLKLLRVLESKEFERVGEATPLKANVRIVAATNAHLPDKVAAKVFREDLYYRLQVVNIHLPPLRERREDIPLLVHHFLQIFRADMNKDISEVAPDVMAILMQHSWPGNVRQLRHALEHACILCPGGEILPAHLPAELDGPAPVRAAPASSPRQRVAAVNSEAIRDALERSGGNRVQAAKLLGISRASLYRKLAEFDLK